MLLQASDETGRLTDREVRDEAMTLLLAGYETTANALAWTWYLIGCAPAAEAMLHDEVDRVLNGRPATSGDVESLPFVRRVVTESMRLFPPAWVVGRRAVEEVEVGGYTFPAGSVVFMSQWVVHRDRRFFADPEEFRPERWTPEFAQSLPKFAYFPFGGGSRSCVGEPFAWMELVLMVATIAQRWRFEIVPDQTIATQPVITLRPKNGIRVTPVLRNTRPPDAVRPFEL